MVEKEADNARALSELHGEGRPLRPKKRSAQRELDVTEQAYAADRSASRRHARAWDQATAQRPLPPRGMARLEADIESAHGRALGLAQRLQVAWLMMASRRAVDHLVAEGSPCGERLAQLQVRASEEPSRGVRHLAGARRAGLRRRRLPEASWTGDAAEKSPPSTLATSIVAEIQDRYESFQRACAAIMQRVRDDEQTTRARPR